MGDQTSYARGSCPKPSHHDNGKCLPQEPLRIRFRHPGYQDTDNVLLTLPGLDFVDGGIHHETARVACLLLLARHQHCNLRQNRPNQLPHLYLQHRLYYAKGMEEESARGRTKRLNLRPQTG
jgi:hypothetical protein